MGTTPLYDWPFPELSDDNSPPAYLKALALAIEASLADVHRAVANVAALPITGDYPGQRIFCTATKEVAVWNGSAWTGIAIPFTPVWTNVTLGTTGLVNTASYIQAAELATVRGILTLGAGGAFTGAIGVAYPVTSVAPGLTPLGTVVFDNGTTSARRAGTVYAGSTTAGFLLNDNPAGSTIVTTGVPFTWGSGCTLAYTYTYEPA